jgi:polyisoprenoid-binding protein YceI
MSIVSGTSVTTDVQLPEAGIWEIDPSHTNVEFVARHLMVSKVRGKFTDVKGTIEIAEDPLQSKARATINAASVDTGDAKRDEHLRSADFFDVENYPTIDFVSTKVVTHKDGTYLLEGDLTVRGVTRKVGLDLEYNGSSATPWGSLVTGFSATTEISRKDFGLEWNVALETGGVLVGDKIRLNIEVEANKQQPEAQK